MASYSSKPPKRLSLLQSTHPALYDGSRTASSNNGTMACPDAPSSSNSRSTRPSPLQFYSVNTTGARTALAVEAGPSTAPLPVTELHESPTATAPLQSPTPSTLPRSAATFARGKAARRQSSICYILSSERFSLNEHSLKATSSKSISPPTSATLNRADKRRSLIVDSKSQFALRRELSTDNEPQQRGGVRGTSGNSVPTAHDRQPMTLVEKHADLLHFIAQKESKCLELRAQLATHEAELLELKRKWEKIVSRGFVTPTTGSSAGSISRTDAPRIKHKRSSTVAMAGRMTGRPASVIGAAGLREGVHGVGRFMAGLGDFAAQATVLPRDNDVDSASSASPTATSVRLSQSSMSSLASACDGEPVLNVDTEVASQDARLQTKQGDDPSQSLHTIRRNTGKKPSSPPILVSPTSQSSTTTKAPTSPTFPSSISTETSGLRRRRSAGHKSSISALSRASTLPSPSPSSSQETRPSPPSSTSSLPPHSSMLGLTALASLALPPSLHTNSSRLTPTSPSSSSPLTSWVNTVDTALPKRTVQTVQTVHKRASAFLADASTSFFAALGSPQLANFGSLGAGGTGVVPTGEKNGTGIRLASSSTSGTKAKALGLGAVGPAVKACAPPALILPVSGPSSGTKSLLDDDEDGYGDGGVLEGQEVMIPDQPPRMATLRTSSSQSHGVKDGSVVANSRKEDDKEDWSW